VGRSNERSPQEQAESRAQSLWTKHKDQGYVEEVLRADAGEDDIGIPQVMLAKEYDKEVKKLSDVLYFVQPKLDGIRCLAIINGFDVSLYSRKRKSIVSVPHIERWLANNFGGDNVQLILDGEIYNHQVRVDEGFNKIQSIVMSKNQLHLEYEMMQYHVFDIITPKPDSFLSRRSDLINLFADKESKTVRLVKTISASIREFPSLKGRALARGYEGIMIRDSRTPYEKGKRSSGLLKYKEFFDDEFEIVGILEGKGKLAGKVGSFICKTAEGETFSAKLLGVGSEQRLREMFLDHSLWKDKIATVRYQEKLESGLPRFCRAIKIHERGDV